MSDHWIILELNPRAEGEDPDLVQRSIASALRGGAEVYLPAAITQVGSNRVVHRYVDGYAFVRRTREDNIYRRLEGTRYVQSILIDRARGKACFATLPSSEIERMRGRLQVEADQGIQIGDLVTVASGPYQDLKAVVLDDYPETATVQVLIRLRSKEAIVSLPRSFLVLVTHSRVREFLGIIVNLRGWVRSNRILRDWTPDNLFQLSEHHGVWRNIYWKHQRLLAFVNVQRIISWGPLTETLETLHEIWQGHRDAVSRLDAVSSMVAPLEVSLTVPRSLTTAHKRWRHLRSWLTRSQDNMPALSLLTQNLQSNSIESLTNQYVRTRQYRSRLSKVTREFQELQLKVQAVEERVVDNILVDGFNLAFRCRFAPGLSDLTDSQGRPTGIITGFVRSLGSYRKRWERSSIIVCWDGSSARRKELYDGYKANRPARQAEAFDQVGFLRDFLPLIGVSQAFCPTEEADDVIATLSATTLKDERNIIISNDHDLLQLIALATVVLIPAVGARQERLFDADEVVAAYGVVPEQLPHYRALAGDTSDNIPGVPRVPTKVLAALIRSHGTLDGLYASGLPGLTKKQYQQLRDSEAQVRLNLKLMELRRDVEVTHTNSRSDQIQAEKSLAMVGMNPQAIAPFFSTPKGHLKES